MDNVQTVSTVPSFDKRAKIIIDAFKGFDKAQTKLSDTVATTMQNTLMSLPF